MPPAFVKPASPGAETPHTVWQTPEGRPHCPPPSAWRSLLCKARRIGQRWRRAIVRISWPALITRQPGSH